jgi:hypothetical protein
VTRGLAVFGVLLVACKSSPGVPLDHRASDPPCPPGPPGCEVDTDCVDGGVCVCGSPGDDAAVTVPTPNVCIPAGDCRVDSDCNPVHYCSPSSTGCSITMSYFCHTPNDDCDNDSDCRAGDFCLYAPGAGKWTCVSGTACDQ